MTLNFDPLFIHNSAVWMTKRVVLPIIVCSLVCLFEGMVGMGDSDLNYLEKTMNHLKTEIGGSLAKGIPYYINTR